MGFGADDGCTPINEETAPLTREYLKLKFIIFKYVWENWDNERLIRKNENLREPFSDYLESLYEDLGKYVYVNMFIAAMILIFFWIYLVEANLALSEANPVLVESRRTRDARAGRARRGVVQVRVPNPQVVRTDLESIHLRLGELMLDEEPFHPAVFHDSTVPPPAAGGAARDENMGDI